MNKEHANEAKALEVPPLEEIGEALHQLLELHKNADSESGVFEVDDVAFKVIASALSSVDDLRAQLADAQKQLAAERAMADRLARVIEYVSYNDYAMAECRDDWREAINDTLYSYQKRQATRKPTQDKGVE